MDARQFVHTLGLKSSTQWIQYRASGKKPQDIPSHPDMVYGNDWKGWSDWLGNVAPSEIKLKSFEDARQFVHTLNLTSPNDWKEYCNSGRKPKEIPGNPQKVYRDKFNGINDWLGIDNAAFYNKKYIDFEKARQFVHTLKLRSSAEWQKYCKSGTKPKEIPYSPKRVYKNKWKSIGDWLGTGSIATQQMKYRPFRDAREFVHSLKLQSQAEWAKYRKSGNKPRDIPSNPNRTYKNEWKGFGDWLGTGTIAPFKMEFRQFEEARQYVHKLGIKTHLEWIDYCKSGKKPKDIPSGPEDTYKKEWKSWGDWLGTGYIALGKKEYKSFEEAKQFVHSLHLKSEKEWRQYLKSGKKPPDIPAHAHDVYENEWKSMGDWLGTGTIASQNKEFMPFEEARSFVHALNLEGARQWEKYCRLGNRPKEIPYRPDQVYEGEWQGWYDWLGIEEDVWSVRKVKELLHGLIESRIIYQWNEAVLYSFLLRKGVLSLDQNRHKQFFKNLIEASRTKEGRKAIEGYVDSDSETPPDLSKLMPLGAIGTTEDTEQEIQSAFSNELTQFVKQEGDPLDYGKIKTAEQVLANTNILESINVDEEAIQFYLDYSIDELWKSAFIDKENTIAGVKKEGKNGNKYHDTVVETFLSDYEGTQNIGVPNGYAFPSDPTLMQLYVAYKTKNLDYFGNFSGTGSGKTLSAVLAGRVIESKMTVIVCPNDVVDQWAKNVVEIFPDSKIKTGKEAFYAKYNENKHQYLVLNYDKFSQEDSPNLIISLVEQKVDFVILDEIHFVKKRDEESSQRRKNLDGLLTAVRKKNNQVKVLGLSATPVVNNLMEGRSLLELITGKIYDDIATKPTIPNAVSCEVFIPGFS